MTTENQTTDLWLPDGAIKAEDRDASDYLKIAILGPQKGGKSNLAATSPHTPIWFNDFDGRFNSLSGKAGVYGHSYLDTTNTKDATAWSKLMQDQNMFEYKKEKGEFQFRTIVNDSINYMLDRAMRFVLVNNSSMRRVVKMGQLETYIPMNYDAYKAEFDLVSNMINRQIELGCDVIAIFHERAEEAPDSTETNPKYTGKYSTHPPRAAALLPLFNELWRVRPNDQGIYKVQVRPNYEFVGATCLNLDEEEEPDITKMIQKHKTRKGN